MAEDDFLFTQGADGLPKALLPAGHEERIQELTGALLAAPDAHTGILAILEVRGGQDLAQAYSEMVIRQALDGVYAWLRDDAPPLLIAHRGAFLLTWLRTARSPLVADMIIDDLDEHLGA